MLLHPRDDARYRVVARGVVQDVVAAARKDLERLVLRGGAALDDPRRLHRDEAIVSPVEHQAGEDMAVEEDGQIVDAPHEDLVEQLVGEGVKHPGVPVVFVRHARLPAEQARADGGRGRRRWHHSFE